MATIQETIQKKTNEYFSLAMSVVKDLYEHPEIGGQEHYAHDLLCKILTEQGFQVTPHYHMETAMLAEVHGHGNAEVYGHGNAEVHGDGNAEVHGKTAGPKIAFLAEYDALPGIGHGCGHNLFCGFSLLAALVMKDIVSELDGSIYFIGTPAEENLGGKITLANAGAFDTIDAALMIHPSTKNGLGGNTNALYPLKFEFFGKNAHACRPQGGASALDAAVQAFTSINFQRQFVGNDCFIHGIIKDGGEAANIIPAYASLEYYFRAPTMKVAQEMANEGSKRAQAAADGNSCLMKTSVYECPYGETLPNLTLANYFKEALEENGATDIQEYDMQPKGSSDVGAVSYKCPTVHAYLKIAPEEVLGHSIEMADATVSPEGEAALALGAKSLAKVAHLLLTDENALANCKKEWQERIQ